VITTLNDVIGLSLAEKQIALKLHRYVTSSLDSAANSRIAVLSLVRSLHRKGDGRDERLTMGFSYMSCRIANVGDEALTGYELTRMKERWVIPSNGGGPHPDIANSQSRTVCRDKGFSILLELVKDDARDRKFAQSRDPFSGTVWLDHGRDGSSEDAAYTDADPNSSPSVHFGPPGPY
jgi:hypothetical protein